MVSVTAQGFLSKSQTKEVEAVAACENQHLPLTITLEKESENSTNSSTCENTMMTISVVDLMTGAPVQEAIINIKLGVSNKTRNDLFDNKSHVSGKCYGGKYSN